MVQASLLSRVVGGGNVHKAVDGAGNSVVWNTYRAVHMTIGLVIMIPTLLVAFFPFMTHFQVQIITSLCQLAAYARVPVVCVVQVTL